VEDILVLDKFFFRIVDTCLNCLNVEDILVLDKFFFGLSIRALIAKI